MTTDGQQIINRSLEGRDGKNADQAQGGGETLRRRRIVREKMPEEAHYGGWLEAVQGHNDP